jgi:hypothetical protein
MATNRISYTARDYESIRVELQNYVRTYYPELIQDFNDASVFSVFLDLNAAIADNLHYNIDRSIQETVLQYAHQRSSIYNIARTYGLKVPGQRPSVALVDYSITVPAFGDGIKPFGPKILPNLAILGIISGVVINKLKLMIPF